jgi:hypothetical protein
MTKSTIHNKINIYYVIIGILIIMPVVLGILLARDVFWQNKPTQNTTATAQLIEPKVSNWKVTDDVLNAPPQNASADQVQAYVALILSKAKETSVVGLKGCKPDPIVAKVPKNGMITIENRDSNDHTIIFGPEKTYVIPKNASTEITVPFPQGIQIIGYGCDGLPKGVGRFVSS